MAMPLQWISRDGKILILAQAVRMFAQGSIAVLLAVYLAKLGFGLVQIGVYFSLGAAGSAFFAFAVALVGERLGRRRLLLLFALLAGVSGLALVVIDNVILLASLAFLGSMSGVPGGTTGPTQPLEQAILADAAPPGRRTDLYAIYRMIAAGATAFGALAAGLPLVLERTAGLSELNAFKAMFVGFVLLLGVTAFLYALLSPAVELGESQRGWVNPLVLPSRRVIFTLTALFSLDHFAGALLIQSLVAYWFNTRFGLELGSLALVFFASQALTAVSQWMAAKVANRIGLINTMVLSHIPASLFLLGAAFAPVAWLAIVFWQLRAFFSQMDVPARDSYTMAIVGPEERIAMASISMVGRSAAGAAGPAVATALWAGVSASAPFVGCAILKVGYDINLYLMFRNVRPPEEARRPPAPGPLAKPMGETHSG